jgi:hypothetical protein
MADFYPLLSRAVAALGPSSPEARQVLYDRARNALMAQLARVEPALTDADVARERAALEACVARIEMEVRTQGPLEPPPPQTAEPEPPRPESRPAPAADRIGVEEEAPSGAEPARLRPAAPAQTVTDRSRQIRLAIVGAGVAAVAVFVGVLAWVLRDPVGGVPPERSSSSASSTAEQPGNGKIADRIGAGAAPSRPAAAPAASAPQVPVAQKATLFLQVAPGSDEPRAVAGRVVWRVASASPQPGQPLETVLVAEVSAPDGDLNLKMSIRRNRDASLPASHLVELVFSSATLKVREASTPILKSDETARGAPLAGVPYPLGSNLAIVALSDLAVDLSRNIELLTSRPWIEIQMRLEDGRRAAFVFEKGISGDRALLEALDSWK